MSQRAKRKNRNENDLPVCPGSIKRRKCKMTSVSDMPVLMPALGSCEEEETMASSSQGGSSWTPRPLSDIKISSIYNRSAAEPPAELYRKDLISAMKLPDSEPLSPSEYWIISDQWKQEWEKGVQVPVNPDSLPEPLVTSIQTPSMTKLYGEFKLPKKFLRIFRDEFYNSEEHFLSNATAQADKACGYDLDDTDIAWLEALNGERALCGQPSVTESQLERIVEELEHHCWNKIQTILKNEEGLGIEYDENVICDVCRSPDSEEGNEMVFCDFCNICVHQACYGITSIPDGSWLCRTCSLGQRPECVLCPNAGGAMKSTRSGQKWAHVSCALWIPEVSIGCVEKMEPITKISSIPQSRWALVCVLCRERVGACIQCSIKTCKTAYHVTCAFKHGLEMKAIIEDEQAEDGVKLRSYCQKHGKINTKEKKSGQSTLLSNNKGMSDSDESEVRRRKRKDMSSEEKNQARAAKLQEIEEEFDKHVNIKDITFEELDIDADAVTYIYNYWKLKRKAGHNKPLVSPRCGELTGSSMRAQGQAADNERMRKFVQLRQDLERVRNLCYMVNRREKLKRSYVRTREQIFHKQVHLLEEPTISARIITAILEANHGPSNYDFLYSHEDAATHTYDVESFLSRIKGLELENFSTMSNAKRQNLEFSGDYNYSSLHFNGSVKKSEKLYGSGMSSVSSNEAEKQKSKRDPESNNNKNLHSKKTKSKNETDSTEEEDMKITLDNKSRKSKAVSGENLKKPTLDRVRFSARRIQDKSSDSDSKSATEITRSRTLQHMERELGSGSGSDSDEFLLIRNKNLVQVGPTSIAEIYSDTDDSSLDQASSKSLYSVNNKFDKNKAGLKNEKSKVRDKHSSRETNSKIPKISTPCNEISQEPTLKDKKNCQSMSKLKESIASALIVPQRQAAKKAFENMQRSQSKKDILNANMNDSTDVKSPLADDNKARLISCRDSKERKSPAAVCASKKQKQESKSLLKEAIKDVKSNDIYDFDKDLGESSEMIHAYVPQRQAAKKAAEHIKSNTSAKSAVSLPTEVDVNEMRIKKETIEHSSKKKQDTKKDYILMEKEKLTVRKKFVKKMISNSPSESSSSSSNSTYSSDSSSSSSDTDQSKLTDKQKQRSSVTKDLNISSSSSSESDLAPFSKSKGKSNKSRSMLRKSRNKFESEDESKSAKRLSEEANETSTVLSTTLIGRKLKKLPDKKLKTSDGRHGHEFQPPSTERNESSRSSSSACEREKSFKNTDQSEKQQESMYFNKQKFLESECSIYKKSDTSNQQQYNHQHKYRPQAKVNESLLSGSRDNDGSRNLPEIKNSNQTAEKIHKTQASQSSKVKEKSSTTSKQKVFETHQRKYSKVSQKEKPTSNQNATTIKTVDKRLNDETNESLNTDQNIEQNISLINEYAGNINQHEQKSVACKKTPEAKESTPLERSREKCKVAKFEKVTKVRKTVKDISKKLLENSSYKLAENHIKLDAPTSQPNENKFEKLKNFDTKKITVSEVSGTSEIQSAELDSTEESTEKINSDILYLKDTAYLAKLNEGTKKVTGNKFYILSKNEQPINDWSKRDAGNKEIHESCSSKSLTISANEENEKGNKKLKSVSRSIFSPQLSTKDPGVPELFDFDPDILSDDMVNDEGFGITRDTEERAPPLFSFNNEHLFKEDPKEDSTRETLNLVEKLRIGLSKKSSQVEMDTIAEPVLDTVIQCQNQEQLSLEHKNVDKKLVDSSKIDFNEIPDKTDLHYFCKDTEEVEIFDKQKSVGLNKTELSYLEHDNENFKKSKVSMADRAKLDRAEADERWVPPSFEGLATSEKSSTLINNHEDICSLTSEQPSLNKPNTTTFASRNSSNDTYSSHPLTHLDEHSIDLVNVGVQEHLNFNSQDQTHSNKNLSTLVEQVSSVQTYPNDISPTEVVNRHITTVLPSNKLEFIGQTDRALEKDDFNPDAIRREYTNVESPFNDVPVGTQCQDTRWAESQVLPSRRSTSSSITSSSSLDDHTGIPPYKSGNSGSIMTVNFQTTALEPSVSAYHSYDSTNNYATPASLFPTQSNSTQLSYSTARIGMFPLSFGASFPKSVMHNSSKTTGDTLPVLSSSCTAAFTSSSHNMAFTAAMVSPNKIISPSKIVSPSLIELNLDEQDQIYQYQHENQPKQFRLHKDDTHKQPIVEEVPTETVVINITANDTESCAHRRTLNYEKESTSLELRQQIKNTSTSLGKKSPSKPTRTSARVTSLQTKSPGKSPRQYQEASKSSSVNRGRGRATKSTQLSGNKGKGRGRGRGRSKTSYSNVSFFQNEDSFQNKFLGTVYDFDSDEDCRSEANIADLRSMRERKKSIEISAVNNKVDESVSSHSPSQLEQFSVQKNCSENKRCSIGLPSVSSSSAIVVGSKINDSLGFSESAISEPSGPVELRASNQLQSLPMPKQVCRWMRPSGSASVLSADLLPDVEEDLDKDLQPTQTTKQQSELSNQRISTNETAKEDSSKFSLVDSRNQLKFKIKGPYGDANYSTTVASPPLSQQNNSSIPPLINSCIVNSGTSNLRRMRKKELLRQYCSQDMNMDDPGNECVAFAPTVALPINRNVNYIPKAVASMISIPTREDYKAVVDANMEKKRRKERASITGINNLIDSSLTQSTEEEQSLEVEKKHSSNGSVTITERRRPRLPRPLNQSSAVSNTDELVVGTPKLKIKISSSVSNQETTTILHHEDRSSLRPPKKRLSNIPNNPTSMEDVKRENLKYRRMIFQNFDNSDKTVKIKKDKKDKISRRKRKGSKKAACVELLENKASAVAPKLIIRLSSACGSSSTASSMNIDVVSGDLENIEETKFLPAIPSLMSENKLTTDDEHKKLETSFQIQESKQLENSSMNILRNVRSNKVSPIKLKLTRCQEGYELKAPAAVAINQSDQTRETKKNSDTESVKVEKPSVSLDTDEIEIPGSN